MGFIISHHRNRLEDFLRAPALVTQDADSLLSDLNQAQAKELTDVIPIYRDLHRQLLPLKEDILATGLFEPMWAGLAPLTYLYLLGQGKNPKTEAELLALFSELKAEQFRDILAMRLQTSADPASLLSKLEKSDRRPETKWYWYQAIQHPDQTRDKLVAVLEKVFTIYTPYYQRFEAEIIATEQNFNPENNLFLDNQIDKTVELIVLSPWMLEGFESSVANQPDHTYVVIGSRIQKIVGLRDGMDTERIAQLLKAMGDPSRYQVLLALLAPNAKNKDIAKQLGITTASVSFHTQKLLNSGLLQTDGQDYRLNHNLIEQLLQKLKEDLC